MALYLGGNKVIINLNNEKMNLQLYSSTPILNGRIIKSSDGYILKDKYGVIITVKGDK